jgi:ABC-type multidrug transport system permease subunit
MSMVFIGLLSLPLSIMELKQSSLFKYIGSSPVNPIKFTIVTISFYIFIAIISSFIILITTIIGFKNEVFPLNGFNHGILGGIFSFPGSLSFIISTSIHLLFVVMAGLFVSTISKTPQQALTIGLVILFPSIFLSGMIVSVDIIAQSKNLN